MDFFLSDLVGSKFECSELNYAKFAFSNLSSVNFYDTDLENVEFKAVDCTNTDFGIGKNLHQESFDYIFYLEGKPPRNLPEDTDLSKFFPYQWVKRDGKDFWQLVIYDNSLEGHDEHYLKYSLNNIPGGPIEDD